MIETFYIPDSRWPSFGAATQEMYHQKFVIQANFHEKVPKDIIETYETTEFLMAHAWYHYPMYDAAIQRQLGTFEMAVKLKCEQLGISLTFKDKKGKTQKKKLANLIEEICKDFNDENIKLYMMVFKDIRNSNVHPNRFTLTGIIGIGVIQRVNEVINQMFL